MNFGNYRKKLTQIVLLIPKLCGEKKCHDWVQHFGADCTLKDAVDYITQRRESATRSMTQR